jgi:hypothetical protein
MFLYHGSYIEIKIPDINLGRFNLDFGKGFYVTTLEEQAERWAIRRVATAKILNNSMDIKPVVTVYDIDLNSLALNILSFNGYTEEWLNFVVKNRGLSEPTFNTKYDIVYGNVADDDVARAVDDYMELLEKNRVNKDVKNALLYQLQFSKPNDQYCFITEKSIKALKFVKSYCVEENKYEK